MSTMSPTKSARKTRSAGSECCTDPSCEFGLRNRYFFGKQLSPYSFDVEQRHILERRRLLNRAIHGWGVVYGYDITVTLSGALTIGSGFALDDPGRELLQTEELTRTANELIVLDKEGRQSKWGEIGAAECWLLRAHYAEQDTDQVKVSDACHCEHWQWNYTCETVRYSLQPKDCAECCEDQGCEWECECGSKGWCDSSGDAPKRGGRCLCDHVTQWSPGTEHDFLCEINEPCGRVRVDLQNGVPLACVKLITDGCEAWIVDNVDACTPRRLVKGNNLLFELIQGCDLTKIIEIGWADWHRKEGAIPFDQFSKSLAADEGKRQEKYVTDKYWVKFSRPVRKASLRKDCFTMTVTSREREGGWGQSFRVPIEGVDTTLEPALPSDPPGYVRSARLIVEGAWLEDAVRGRRNLFQGGETTIEIEIRGDYITDCNGQTVDANAAGLTPFPTGNGTPGGTFLSSFQVGPASEYAYRAPVDSAESVEGV